MELILSCNGQHINEHWVNIGHCNDRLSDKWIIASIRLAKVLKEEPIDFIFCSDIGDRRTTADLVAEELEEDKFHIIVDLGLREKSAEICGPEKKKHIKNTWGTDPEQNEILHRLFIKSETRESWIRLDETDQQVRERAKKFLRKLTKEYPSWALTLVIGNPIFNSFLVACILGQEGKEYNYITDPCSISRFLFREDKWHLIDFNNVKHLHK